MTRSWYCAFTIVSVFLLLAGCVRMGPDYTRPDLGPAGRNQYQHGPAAEDTAPAGERWWEVFGDRQLNALVLEALEHNWDIRQATARVLEVRTQLVQTRADRFPALSIQAQAQKQRLNVPSLSLGPGGFTQVDDQETVNAHALSLPATFELDLWGRLSRAEEAVRAELLRAEETRHTVSQTVAGETASLYLQIEGLERRIQVAQNRIATFGKSLALVEGRYRRGLTSILDVRQSRRLLASSEAALPGLRQELGIAQQRQATLLGRYPETTPPRMQPEDYFIRLKPVPPGLPSDLLVQRPDIRAAEARLTSLNARVGAARAARFPRITLTAAYGYSSQALTELFDPESELRSMALGMVQPIFDMGRLKAGQKAAEARYRQGVADYAKTVLNAFFEVEKALLTRKEQMKRRDRILEWLKEARATQEAAESRYLRGLVDYLNVLEAMNARFEAEDNLVLVDLAIFQNRVSLHRALGGAWARPEPIEEKEEIWEVFPVLPEYGR